MGGNYILGVDAGSQSSKILIFDRNGRVVCSGSDPLQPMHLAPGGVVEHPGDDWWDSICRASKKTFAAFDGNIHDIMAVGLCTIRFCRAYLDKDGLLAQPALSWMDARVSRPYIHENPAIKYACTSSGYITHRFTGNFADTAANHAGMWPMDSDTWEWLSDGKDFDYYGYSCGGEQAHPNSAENRREYQVCLNSFLNRVSLEYLPKEHSSNRRPGEPVAPVEDRPALCPPVLQYFAGVEAQVEKVLRIGAQGFYGEIQHEYGGAKDEHKGKEYKIYPGVNARQDTNPLHNAGYAGNYKSGDDGNDNNSPHQGAAVEAENIFKAPAYGHGPGSQARRHTEYQGKETYHVNNAAKSHNLWPQSRHQHRT